MTITQLREELAWLHSKLNREPSFIARVDLHRRIDNVRREIAMFDTNRRNP